MNHRGTAKRLQMYSRKPGDSIVMHEMNVLLGFWEREHPRLSRDFGFEVIQFNYNRGVHKIEDLLSLEAYTDEFGER